MMASNRNDNEYDRQFVQIFVAPSRDRLRIPSAFAKKYGTQLPKCVLLSTKDGKHWQVYISSDEKHMYLGFGWSAFRNAYCTTCFEVIHFLYNGVDKFTVTIFGEDSMPKPLASLQQAVLAWRLKGCPVEDTISQSLSDCEDDPMLLCQLDSLEAVLEAKKKHKSEICAEDDLTLTKLPNHSKAEYSELRTGPLVNPAEVKVMMKFKESLVYESEGESYVLGSDVGIHSNAVESPISIITKHRAEAAPHCAIEIIPAHLVQPYKLPLPAKFTRNQGITGTIRRYLKPGYGVVPYDVSCEIAADKETGEIFEGWEWFCIDNGLKVGDTLVIEQCRKMQQHWDITIFREV